MKQITNVIEDVLIASGIAISLADIQQVLSIIILVLDVVWILSKLGIKIYQRVKNKDYESIADDIKDSKDELEDLSNGLSNTDVKQIEEKPGIEKDSESK